MSARIRELVFEAIKAASIRGLTDRELQKKLGLNPSTVRARRVELWKGGRIRVKRDQFGHPVYRNLGTRRAATVWVLGQEEVCAHCGSVYTKTFRDQDD